MNRKENFKKAIDRFVFIKMCFVNMMKLGAFREIACYIFNIEFIACWSYIPRSMYPEWCINSTTSLLF